MKLLQFLVAVLTVLLFLARQNVFARVCPMKPQSLSGSYCGAPRASSLRRSARTRDRGALCAGLGDGFSLPKHKKDPKIRVDNEDIDYPVE